MLDIRHQILDGGTVWAPSPTKVNLVFVGEGLSALPIILKNLWVGTVLKNYRKAKFKAVYI